MTIPIFAWNWIHLDLLHKLCSDYFIVNNIPVNVAGGGDSRHEDGEYFDNIDAFGSWRQVPILFVPVY